jgi:uncharacterized protein YegP (UPF0339 family)
MRRPHFEVYPQHYASGDSAGAPNGYFGWRLKAANSEIIAVGEGFTRAEDAERACTGVAEAIAQVDWVGPEGSAVSVERVAS